MRTRSRFSQGLAGAVAFLSGVALLGASQAGCESLECGEGTREEGGQCVPTTVITGPDGGGIHCGSGTILVGNECVPAEDLCGEYTRPEPLLDDAGVPTGAFVCVGKAPTGEEPPPECPSDNEPGYICLSGWVRWLVDEDGNVVETVVRDPTADATALRIEVYDPIEYAQDQSIAPLAAGVVDPKTGTFMLPQVPLPGSGYIALATDDFDEGGEDVFALSGIPYQVGTANLVEIDAVAITTQQEQDWTEAIGGPSVLTSVGCDAPPGGGEPSLSSCGTWIGIFSAGSQDAPGGPIEGVIPIKSPAAPIPPEQIFFPGFLANGAVVFDDPTAGVVWSDGGGPYDYTGTHGIVFHPNAEVAQYGGICEAGTQCDTWGCVYSADLQGGSAPGALFVQYLYPRLGCEPPQ